jgi:hypothetical protein
MIYEGTSQIHQLMHAGYALGCREDEKRSCELPAYDGAGVGISDTHLRWCGYF